MEAGLAERAIAAASSVALEQGLPVDDVVLVQNSNALALRLLPCDLLARIAVVGREVAALEVALAQGLAAVSAPVAQLDPRVEPIVHQRDGFAVTLWTYYGAKAPRLPAAEYAGALHLLHDSMSRLTLEAPHFTDRVSSAEGLLTERGATPALRDDERALLLTALRRARDAISSHEHEDRLLHGEPHRGNLIATADGPRFIDLETCCRGPVELDVAHVPDDVSRLYPGTDQAVLQECRRLVLAMVAAWRWDADDDYPDGPRQGRQIVELLRGGPPWPSLDVLTPS